MIWARALLLTMGLLAAGTAYAAVFLSYEVTMGLAAADIVFGLSVLGVSLWNLARVDTAE